MNRPVGNRLLGASDAQAVDWVNPDVSSTIALVCEHAGNAVPCSLNNLGLTADQLQEHTAVDIGAEATARLMAEKLNAPLLMQRYSRLVIDCNRPVQAADSMPETSHGTVIPANSALSDKQRKARIEEIFEPYDSALGFLLEIPDRLFAFSIHSFTPALNELERPWDIGLLFRYDERTSNSLYRYLSEKVPDLTIGLNEPYEIDDESDWFVPRHAERLGLNHSLIEIRNDHITTAAGQAHMATILADAIKHVSARDRA